MSLPFSLSQSALPLPHQGPVEPATPKPPPHTASHLHLGPTWHLVLTLPSMYTPPAHVAVTRLKLMTVMKQDLLLIHTLLCHLMGWEADAFIK